ncbi:BACON domain-containing protein [Bacteroides thetaiotaomicron]|uniref:BACON domain-containing protein n=1 Tax=Bacteroides thetaiotaomicron TaxID=818 RepID=UPI001F3E1D0B|nr:BACON domain-containing protein [Bacteroides thetaiotaomicron]MCE8487892.1 BACON domain-containing protein [Bacteroides thetaiotaomicron]
MIKMQFKNILAIGLASMLSLFSCDDQIEDLQSPPFLKVEQQSLNFGENGEIYILEVRCNEEYSVKTADGLEDWCSLKKLENGDLELEIHPNEDKNIRRGRIFIHALS